MTTFHERSAGVIPFRRETDQLLLYLVLHSATVRNPRASGNSPREASSRENRAGRQPRGNFRKRPGSSTGRFSRDSSASLSYTYVRRGRKVVKTVVYYLAEVGNSALPTRSVEHVEDPHGQWFRWGTFEQINDLLYHTKIRQVFAEADGWLRK